jgi:uncharacterized protein YndB with AHSA1/START domain
MEERSVTHSTFVIERRYPAAVDKVFAALADPAKKRLWFAEGHNHDVEEFTMDFRIGGSERSRYRFKEGTPFPGTALANDSVYQDIVPGRRVVMASIMTLGDRRISATLATFELLAAENGTELVFTHQGAFFEGSDGSERREQGWQQLFERLAKELARS